jgi:hypothetical protein
MPDFDKGLVTLAALTVEDGKLVRASNGVSFDPETGVVGFPNPRNLKFVPVISDTVSSSEHYMTTKNFIREIGVSNQFRVWSTALDTGDRNYAPTNFTAIVVGF